MNDLLSQFCLADTSTNHEFKSGRISATTWPRLSRFEATRQVRWVTLGFAMVLALSVLPVCAAGHMVAATIWVRPVTAVLGASTIVGAVQDGSPVFRNTWLRRAGLISYSLPGLHESFAQTAFSVLISVMAATLSWVPIEGPLLRGPWRARFSESLSPARST